MTMQPQGATGSGPPMPRRDPTPAAQPLACCSGAMICCSRRANSIDILKKFHCYSIVIPLFRKPAVRLQAIENAGFAARHRAAIFQKFAVNSAVTSNYEAISRR
jgi:hypothetical protein